MNFARSTFGSCLPRSTQAHEMSLRPDKAKEPLRQENRWWKKRCRRLQPRTDRLKHEVKELKDQQRRLPLEIAEYCAKLYKAKARPTPEEAPTPRHLRNEARQKVTLAGRGLSRGAPTDTSRSLWSNAPNVAADTSKRVNGTKTTIRKISSCRRSKSPVSASTSTIVGTVAKWFLALGQANSPAATSARWPKASPVSCISR